LKKRVLSYFSKRASEKQKRIVDEASTIEHITLFNEREALLTEANFIYTYKPRFNVLLKDARAYPYIEFVGKDFPYIKITHEKSKNSLGPFTSVSFLRELLNIIQPIVQLRTCTVDLSKIDRPCFEYHIKRCSAPCAGLITKEEYAERVKMAKKFFRGNVKFIKKWLESKIELYSQKRMFESAQSLKSVYERLNDFLVKQNVELPASVNIDAFEIKNGVALLMKVRNGMLLAKLEFEFNGGYVDFLKEYYFGKGQEVPKVILIFKEFRGMKTWSKLLKAKIRTPQKPYERAILSTLATNLNEVLNSKSRKLAALQRLKEVLNLTKLPILIEGIDISHTAGALTVASVVTFINGFPKKSFYRKYNLANFSHPDDFEAMRQVVKRRYSKHPLPDLLLIDGGKGQVNAVVKALKAFGKGAENVVGLAKEDERIVFADNRKDLHLALSDEALKMLIAVRDESHRFATSYHYLLRDKKMTRSTLDSIRGIGPKRKKALLRAFGSVKKIREASLDELKAIVGEKMARKLKEHFTPQGNIS
jgi:excinuclease ABC subunit C